MEVANGARVWCEPQQRSLFVILRLRTRQSAVLIVGHEPGSGFASVPTGFDLTWFSFYLQKAPVPWLANTFNFTLKSRLVLRKRAVMIACHELSTPASMDGCDLVCICGNGLSKARGNLCGAAAACIERTGGDLRCAGSSDAGRGKADFGGADQL